ncbi:hypothetical protein BH10BAC5_BH10BAC5_06050 [soil metagenome]
MKKKELSANKLHEIAFIAYNTEEYRRLNTLVL